MRKVALVTGGARGIGRAIAQDLATDYDVSIVWHKAAPQDPSLHAIQANLANGADCVRVIEDIQAHHGRLDIIVNNAGTVAASALDDSMPEGLPDMFALNVFAPHALLAAALPILQPGASVINISSVNAELPPRGAAMFGASKAALNLWTKGAAKELGPKGIRVNAIQPGAINLPEAPRSDELTDLFVKDTALGRVGHPNDIAKVVRFLASDDAGFITGEVITVSGGYRL